MNKISTFIAVLQVINKNTVISGQNFVNPLTTDKLWMEGLLECAGWPGWMFSAPS